MGGVLGVFLLSAAACVALVVGASTFGFGAEQRDTVAHTFQVAGTPNVTVRNVTGSTTVVTGADGTVRAVVTRRARDIQARAARDDLGQVVVQFAQSGGVVSVAVQYPSGVGFGRMLAADVVVTVPRATNLDLQAVTGNVAATGVSGTLAVHLVTGNVEVRDATLTGTSHIQLTTGQLTFDGTLTDGTALDARVVTGSAVFTLPADTPARLAASTVTGAISVHGWAIPVTGATSSHHASGDLGVRPSGTLTIAVTTGSIALTAR